ncbi:MAG TPA: hypothetical protein EYG74_08725 [Sulfurimonas autotrophica]|nr:hypothetical protein [Sulfurimonas autotrophica]
MNITTKFNVAEEVFIPYKNDVMRGVIERIVTSISHGYDEIAEVRKIVLYDITTKDRVHRAVSENTIYKTKKEAALAVIRNMGYYVAKKDMKNIDN